MRNMTLGLCMAVLAACRQVPPPATPPPPGEAQQSFPTLQVKYTPDFEVTGDGAHDSWSKCAWTPLRKRQPDGHPYETRFKMLYSAKGVYVLMDGTDRKLTTTMREDFLNLWTEDVYEAFFWTDESVPLYFEYEISPLNYELPILIPNTGGAFMGWRPWHYEGGRKIRKATSAIGGAKESGTSVQGWRAEFFIPYELLKPLKNIPPRAGTKWRANFYRMDYDDGKTTQWDWSPVGPSFHEYKKFGVLIFE